MSRIRVHPLFTTVEIEDLDLIEETKWFVEPMRIPQHEAESAWENEYRNLYSEHSKKAICASLNACEEYYVKILLESFDSIPVLSASSFISMLSFPRCAENSRHFIMPFPFFYALAEVEALTLPRQPIGIRGGIEEVTYNSLAILSGCSKMNPSDVVLVNDIWSPKNTNRPSITPAGLFGHEITFPRTFRNGWKAYRVPEILGEPKTKRF